MNRRTLENCLFFPPYSNDCFSFISIHCILQSAWTKHTHRECANTTSNSTCETYGIWRFTNWRTRTYCIARVWLWYDMIRALTLTCVNLICLFSERIVKFIDHRVDVLFGESVEHSYSSWSVRVSAGTKIIFVSICYLIYFTVIVIR